MKKPIELMRLIRVPAGRRLVIQVRGRQFSKIGDIPDERVRAVLLQSIGDLLDDVCDADDLEVLGYVKAENPKVAHPSFETKAEAEVDAKMPQTAPNPSDADGDQIVKDDPITEAKRAAFLSSLERQAPSSTTTDSRIAPREGSRSILGRLRQSRQRSTPEPANSGMLTLNIAGQIHDLVQNELRQFPELEGRRVTIRQNIDGGLKIIVDNHQFDDVSEISDPQIRMVIKNAIKKWEGSN